MKRLYIDCKENSHLKYPPNMHILFEDVYKYLVILQLFDSDWFIKATRVDTEHAQQIA